MTLRQALAFALLMGAGEKIFSKSPSYMIEKLETLERTMLKDVAALLDSEKRVLFFKYLITWNSHLPDKQKLTSDDEWPGI